MPPGMRRELLIEGRESKFMFYKVYITTERGAPEAVTENSKAPGFAAISSAALWAREHTPDIQIL
jgi:mevalonate pyrophosphate decarboxylase